MVLITGATGNVGREVVKLIRDEGGQVAAVSRNPAAASLPAKAHVIAGDPSQPQRFATALKGIEAVLLSPRALGRRGKGVRDAGGVERGQARHRAVRAHGAVW